MLRTWRIAALAVGVVVFLVALALPAVGPAVVGRIGVGNLVGAVIGIVLAIAGMAGRKAAT